MAFPLRSGRQGHRGPPPEPVHDRPRRPLRPPPDGPPQGPRPGHARGPGGGVPVLAVDLASAPGVHRRLGPGRRRRLRGQGLPAPPGRVQEVRPELQCDDGEPRRDVPPGPGPDRRAQQHPGLHQGRPLCPRRGRPDRPLQRRLPRHRRPGRGRGEVLLGGHPQLQVGRGHQGLDGRPPRRRREEIGLGDRVYASSITPLPSDDRFVVMLRDITEFRRLEKIKKDFVVNVSHELKTPLAAIKGFVETMEPSIGADNRGYLEIVKRNTDRLIAIVEDLIVLSRLEDQGTAVRKEKVDVRALAANVLKLFEKAAAAKGLEVSVEADAGPAARQRRPLRDRAPAHQPRRQRRQVHRQGPRPRPAPLRRQGADDRGRGHRDRHRLRRHPPHLRTVLRRRQVAVEKARRDGARPVHRQAHRPGPSGDDLGRQPAGGGDDLHRLAPALLSPARHPEEAPQERPPDPAPPFLRTGERLV